jgi:hypothetical protein
MNDRYAKFQQIKHLLRKTPRKIGPRELGRALIELGIAVSGLSPDELHELYPELELSDAGGSSSEPR